MCTKIIIHVLHVASMWRWNYHPYPTLPPILFLGGARKEIQGLVYICAPFVYQVQFLNGFYAPDKKWNKLFLIFNWYCGIE